MEPRDELFEDLGLPEAGWQDLAGELESVYVFVNPTADLRVHEERHGAETPCPSPGRTGIRIYGSRRMMAAKTERSEPVAEGGVVSWCL